MAVDISWTGLFISYLCILIPILIHARYATGLVKPTIIAFVRMTLQLLALGLYLGFIFKKNIPALNLVWVVVMVTLTAYTIVDRSHLNLKRFFWPVLLALITTITIVDLVALGLVIGPESLLQAQYLIPISGMIMGNILSHTIMGISTFDTKLKSEKMAFQWRLACGATREEALAPIIREALIKAVNPMVASMSVMGLISLPGMMTGQILGGNSPDLAVKYQIVIMLAIFVSSNLALWLSLKMIGRATFDKYDNYKA